MGSVFFAFLVRMTFYDMSCDDHDDCSSWYNDDTIDLLMAATNKVSETEAVNDFTVDSFSTLTRDEKFRALQMSSMPCGMRESWSSRKERREGSSESNVP